MATLGPNRTPSVTAWTDMAWGWWAEAASLDGVSGGGGGSAGSWRPGVGGQLPPSENAMKLPSVSRSSIGKFIPATEFSMYCWCGCRSAWSTMPKASALSRSARWVRMVISADCRSTGSSIGSAIASELSRFSGMPRRL